MAILPYQSDCYVEVNGVTDVLTDTVVNDATVTVTLWTKTGDPVTGAENLTASYVAASDGNYRATIPHTADVELNQALKADVSVSKGGYVMHFWQDVFVERYPA